MNPNEPKPQPGTPAPPSWLNKDARDEWRRIVPQLRARGLLELIDRSTLVCYVTAWADLRDAERRLVEEGSTVTTQKGYLTLNPQLRRAQVARAQLVRIGQEFGLSPSARSRVHANPVPLDAEADARRKRFFGESSSEREALRREFGGDA